MKMVQRWVSIFLSAAILLTLVVCGSVYVLSITPVDAASPVGAFMNPQIETFNAALQKMAIEKGVDYIDLAPIFRRHKIQYDEDGSHFTNAFYPILLGYLKEWTDLAHQPRGPAVTDSNEAYKTALRHSVFLGDSILGALSYLNKLDPANVIAPSGATLDLALLNVEKLAMCVVRVWRIHSWDGRSNKFRDSLFMNC